MLTRLRAGVCLALLGALLASGVLQAQALKYRPQFPQIAAAETRGAFTGGTPTVWLVDPSVADASGAGTVVTTNNCATITCRRGTFRMAVEATGNRLVLFERSGYITLTLGGFVDTVDTASYGPYIEGAGNLTIAGQSAPNPGVTMRGGGLYFDSGANDLVIQHLRIRPGGAVCTTALGIFPYTGALPNNAVLDHVSVSWGQDDNVIVGGSNVLVWRSIIAEGSANTGDDQLDIGDCTGGYSLVSHGIGGGASPFTMIQTLLAHNAERNPYIGEATNNVLLNNVLYNWSGLWGFFHSNITRGGSGTGAPWHTTAVGNVFLGGLDSGSSYAFSYVPYLGGDVAGNSIYGADNVIDSWATPLPDTVQPQANGYSYNPNVGSPPATAPLPSGFTPLAGGATQAFVLANAGARPANRDSVDARVTASVTNKSGHWVNYESEVGGYPTLAANYNDLTDDIPAAPFSDPDMNGYTEIEEWLEELALGVEGESVIEPDDECLTPCEFVVSGGSTNSTSVTTSAPVDTSGASLYVAGICSYGNGSAQDPGALSTVGVPSDVWTPLTKRGNVNAVARLYYALNPAVGTRTFSVASVAASYPSLVVYGFSDRATTSVLNPVETGASATGAVTSLAPGTISPTTDNQVLTTLVNSYEYGAAPTVTGGFLVPPEAVQPSDGAWRLGCAMGYLAQTVAVLSDPTWTFTSVEGAAAMAGWKAYLAQPPEVHPRRFRLE